MARRLETAIPFDNHRSTPLAAMAPFVQSLEAGNVDYLWLWDEFSGWFPGNLWTEDNTAAAPFIEPNSTYDPFVQAAYAAALKPDIGLRLSTDAIRSNPAELLRKMMSLGNATTGKTVIAIGAGELRQTRPFGYKRSEGLARMEDLFKLIHLLYDNDGPINFEGNHWTFKNATLGTSRPATRPEFWALGGGPKLLDIAAQYADGFEMAVPQSTSTPEQFAANVTMMRDKVEGFGRDPDAFGFGLWLLCVIHDDDEQIDRILDNPLMKYLVGQFGRLNGDDWKAEGETAVMPAGYHYAMKWAPFEQSNDEIQRIVDAVPRSMARKGVAAGTPAQISQLLADYREAGADFVGLLDLTGLVDGPATAADGFRRGIEVLGNFKGVTSLR